MNATLADAYGALCPAVAGVRTEHAGAGPGDELDDRRDADLPGARARPWDDATEKLIANCANAVGRYLNPALTRQDLLQEGRMALLESLRAGRVPADPAHRTHYILRRVRGAMQDCNRAVREQQPDDVRAISDATPEIGRAHV